MADKVPVAASRDGPCCYYAGGSLLHLLLFHSGEITVSLLLGYDPATHLGNQDVAVDDQECTTMVHLFLKSSKSDPFQRGVRTAIGGMRDDL